MIVFTGGAGLGQFPHIAYNELLTRISDRLNAVCISAPYQVAGLDHFTMAKTTGEQLRRALVFCQDDPARQYPENLPTYALSHSLGGKLQTIYLGATGQNYNGIGLISFNNFSFGRTISMVKEFASQLQETTSPGGFSNMGDNSAILNTVFSFAENLVTGMGVDFTPSPADTERLIQLRYNKDLQAKTRMFVMDEDNLDSSEQFVNLCSCSEGDEQVTVSVCQEVIWHPYSFDWVWTIWTWTTWAMPYPSMQRPWPKKPWEGYRVLRLATKATLMDWWRKFAVGFLERHQSEVPTGMRVVPPEPPDKSHLD